MSKLVEIPLLVVEPAHVAALLEGVVRLNQLLLPPDAPPVTAFRYKREPKGKDVWQPADILLRSLEGDCEDLSAYHAAWCRMHRIPADVAGYWAGRHTIHMINDVAGRPEDPSAATGMLDRERRSRR